MKRALRGLLPVRRTFLQLGHAKLVLYLNFNLKEISVSNTKVSTELKGFHGPYFPRFLDRIQKRYKYKAVRWNSQFFDDITETLRDGKITWHPKTADGYVWTAGVSFKHGKVRFKVLFPMTNDAHRMEDGTNSDRHVALYVAEGFPDASQEQIAYAAEIFAGDVITVYRHLYKESIRDGKKKAAKATI